MSRPWKVRCRLDDGSGWMSAERSLYSLGYGIIANYQHVCRMKACSTMIGKLREGTSRLFTKRGESREV